MFSKFTVMKNIHKTIIYTTLTASLLSGACSSKLDIEPKQSISTELALSTPSDVRNALIGAYTVIAEGALYGTNLVMVPDLYFNSNYVGWTGTFSSYREIFNHNIVNTNEEASRTWTHAYEAINIANTVLSALDIINDPNEKDEIEGRALFIRGIMHFELVRLYGIPFDNTGSNNGLGVPIITQAVKSVSDVNNSVTRNSVAEVYTAVENDLTTAISKLQNSSHLYAAQGMLARVYLQQSKFQQARDMAHAVISSGEFSLASNLEAPFRVKNSSEGVFEIQQTEQSNAGSSNDGLATFYSSYKNITGGNVGRGDLNVSAAYYNSLDDNDKRKTQMIYDGTGQKSGYFSRKWYNYYDNIPVVRLTELYLTRAECNFRLSTNVGDSPLNDINTLRERAGLSPLMTLTLEDILNERDIELAFEGYRLHDYKRTKRSIGAVAWNDPKLVFPIPYREIVVNPNLQQNTGY